MDDDLRGVSAPEGLPTAAGSPTQMDIPAGRVAGTRTRPSSQGRPLVGASSANRAPVVHGVGAKQRAVALVAAVPPAPRATDASVTATPAPSLGGGLEQSAHPTQAQGAPDLSVTVGSGRVQSLLAHHAPGAVAIVNGEINRLKRIADATERDALYDLATTASNFAGKLALKTVELVVGKQVKVDVTMTNQASVPKYDKLPEHIRAKYDEVHKALEMVDDGEGTFVPQDSDNYYNMEGHHDDVATTNDDGQSGNPV